MAESIERQMAMEHMWAIHVSVTKIILFAREVAMARNQGRKEKFHSALLQELGVLKTYGDVIQNMGHENSEVPEMGDSRGIYEEIEKLGYVEPIRVLDARVVMERPEVQEVVESSISEVNRAEGAAGTA